MEELNRSLLALIEKLNNYRALYDQNEMAVREQIINPILRTLDWDPEDPGEVQPNVPTEEGVPDYSLIKDGRKVLFLEAKKLGVDVEQRQVMSQLAKYSFSEGTKYGVVTNGAVWVLIRSFEEGKTLIDRVVWKADLLNDNLPSVCRKLSTLTRSNIEQVEALVRKAQILDEIWADLLEAPQEVVRALVPLVKSFIDQGYRDCQFEDSEIEDWLNERINEVLKAAPESVTAVELVDEVGYTGGPPKRMRLGTERFELRSSLEILLNTANWLIKNGKLKPSDCPVSFGYRRNLVNTQPKHKNGDDFRAPKRLSNGLWIDAHFSTVGTITRAKKLLERFGYPSSTLVLGEA